MFALVLPGTTRWPGARDKKISPRPRRKKLSRRRAIGVDLGVSTEAELVAGLGRGDDASFDRVYELYNTRLFGFLIRMARRRDVAEDLLQETWMRLAAHAPRLRDDTRLEAWLFTVARNVYRSYYRWRILDGERMAELTLARYRRAEALSPFEDAAASELQIRLERALLALPARYREVLILVAIERMAPRDAAVVLGIKADALRQRLARARGMIAKKLEEVPRTYPRERTAH